MAKYPRYDSEADARAELHDKVIDEVADVGVILEHVKAIMELNQSEIEARKEVKINRLNRWLKTGKKTQQITTEDREIEDKPVSSLCRSCDSEALLPCV